MKSINRAPESWIEALARCQKSGAPHVLATVVSVTGSAPRALQAKMVITKDAAFDTLGGGGLEHDVMATARKLLAGKTIDDTPAPKLRSQKAQAARRDSVVTKHYPLGAKLAQCCGGSVTVMFECFNLTPPLSLLVFGAGHVATALMKILAELPCKVDWVDSRAEMFAPFAISADNDAPSYNLPDHIRAHVADEPVDFIKPFIQNALAKSDLVKNKSPSRQQFILVMTHDHSLDFELIRAAIDEIGDNPDKAAPYIGCIGSATKSKRFYDRLLARGYSEDSINALTMPIGIAIGGKEPMAVAVSIAAQVLKQYHQV
ncbi:MULTISPECIES: xanthine dehydrogenase accessory protein XdhC [Psychrobacter]|uniref:xanthine dehydrogenase accessory protein XdhC n=1 Tax=Psychrobacter TaxID=497 RepID=UPI00280B6076|nr:MULTISPECIES: xanthine dehydrogenase accessory protein XdhC [Psychrobacter]